MEKRSSQKTPFSVIIVFKELQRNQFQDWCTRARVTYIVAFQWRGVQVEPRPGWKRENLNVRRNVQRMQGREPQARTTYNSTVPKSISATMLSCRASINSKPSHTIYSVIFKPATEHYRYMRPICVTIETHAARFQAKTLAKTYTRAVSAKTQNYTVATLKKRVRKRWLAWPKVRNFVDTKRKSLIRLWQMKIQFNLYRTFFLT